MGQPNHRLFTLGSSVAGVPEAVLPGTLKQLGALEVRDLERWVKATPSLLGEDLLIVTSQLADNVHFRDRLDLLALDRSGMLVVVELKRDEATSSVELQALKYAARVSTMTADEVITVHHEWLSKQMTITRDEARQRLADFVTESAEDDPLASLDDEDVRPRIIFPPAASLST